MKKRKEIYYVTATERDHKLLEIYMLDRKVEYQIEENPEVRK